MEAETFLFAVEQFIQQQRQQRQPLVRWMEEDCVYAAGVYQQMHHEWLPSAVQKHIEKLGLQPRGTDVAAVAQMVRNAAFIEVGQPPCLISTGEQADVIVCRNIVLQLAADGSITYRQHDPDLFCLCMLPFDFDPWATCPKWREFVLWMVSGDEAEARLIQQFAAWPLVSHRLKMEKMLWLFGPGANGKSTALRVLRHVYGEANTSAVCLSAFNQRTTFHLQPTLNKLANFVMDGELSGVRSVAALNSFISGDPMNIPRKYKRDAVVEPTTAVFVASNSGPELKDKSQAFWRRVLPIECQQRPVVPRPSLLNELLDEAPGILNWLLEPLADLLQRQAFDIPQTVRDRIASAESQVSATRQFIAEKLERGGEDDFIIGKQLTGVFDAWCKENGYRMEPLTTIKDELKCKLGSEYGRHRVKGFQTDRPYGWPGIRWQPEEQQAAQDALRVKTAPDEAAIIISKHADLIAKHHEAVAVLSAKTRDFDKQSAQIQSQDAELIRLRRALRESQSDQSWATERLQMAETLAKQNGVARRQSDQIIALRTKVRLLKGILEKQDCKINARAPTRNSAVGPGPVDPAKEAEVSELLKRLGGIDDDVVNDGPQGQTRTPQGEPGLPTGHAATCCPVECVGEDDYPDAGDGEASTAGE